MTLEVLICTYGAGITQAKSMVLAPARNIKWYISYQEKPEGLARNRNNALRHSSGDICVLADDDNKYSNEELQAVLRLFEERPDLDVALLKSLDYDGREMKDYPKEPFDYAHRPYGYYVQSSDIAFRRNSIDFGFDERFGIGTDLPGGEDELFVHEAWKRGLKVEYHPLVLCRTAPITTGSRIDSDPALLRTKGALLSVFHGRLGATLRVVKYAFTHHVSLKPMLEGVWRSL